MAVSKAQLALLIKVFNFRKVEFWPVKNTIKSLIKRVYLSSVISLK